MEKIIACVVTYNRLELLKQVIDGLRNQTRKIDEIVVINNGSTDGTGEWLQDQNDITTINQDNLGSSGGQYTASKYAYSKGADYIWLMDDDVVAKPNCLEILLKYQNKYDILCPLRYNIEDVYLNDVKKITLDNPFKSIWREIISKDDLSNEAVPVEVFTFEGPLIHKSVFEKIGLPEKDFFIYGDDTEFSLRALKNNFKAAVIRDAV
ncbi:MAG TPA: glycosyltransferase, partial [Candidatus Kapabacteria bacterium]|nr:glycosyltransferase [Candidatus Kapabacteria bacterium]